MARHRIYVELSDRDYKAFRAAIGSMNPFKTPGRVTRALINAYVIKHDGTGIKMGRVTHSDGIVKPTKDSPKKLEARRCKLCDQYKPAIDFTGTKFHTICRACVTHSEIIGKKRPGTPTSYLASQYHYRKIRKEYMDRFAAGDKTLPSWLEYQKQQRHRKQDSRKEYFERLEGR